MVKLLRLARLARWSRLINRVKDLLSINPGHLRLMQARVPPPYPLP